jgi:hypothetical protein
MLRKLFVIAGGFMHDVSKINELVIFIDDNTKTANVRVSLLHHDGFEALANLLREKSLVFNFMSKPEHTISLNIPKKMLCESLALIHQFDPLFEKKAEVKILPLNTPITVHLIEGLNELSQNIDAAADCLDNIFTSCFSGIICNTYRPLAQSAANQLSPEPQRRSLIRRFR